MQPIYKTTSELLADFTQRQANTNAKTAATAVKAPEYKTAEQMLATFQHKAAHRAA